MNTETKSEALIGNEARFVNGQMSDVIDIRYPNRISSFIKFRIGYEHRNRKTVDELYNPCISIADLQKEDLYVF